MSIDNPSYDVALSFLSKDEVIAHAFHQRLAEGLQVFFFPRNQDELAGTDGLESMRKPFFEDSRVMVVLYRDGWGSTPWTRVEETAIKDACLEHGWERLCFVVLDRSSKPPKWLPTTHVRFNYEEYGLEQAVGVIKARVQERGGQNKRLTPLRRAQLLDAEEAFRADKARMNTQEGLNSILKSIDELFQEIEKHCKDLNENGRSEIRCAVNFRRGQNYQACTLTDGQVSLNIFWRQKYVNSLDGTALQIREYSGNLIIPPGHVRIKDPDVIQLKEYSPDLSFAREYGWTQKGAPQFVSSNVLAEKCVLQFLDLMARDVRGEIKRQSLF